MGSDKEYSWDGSGGSFTVTVDEGVFAPSSTSRVLGDSMEIDAGDTVLDVGCGSGLLSFVAARLGAARVVGCDVSPAAVECAKSNAERLGLSEVTEFRCGSLLDPVRDVKADVVIADVSGIPDAIARASGWFPDGHGGGPTGAELPVAMIADLPEHMTAKGRAYVPTATLQDESTVLAAARKAFGSALRPVGGRDFPLPEAVTRVPDVAKLIADGVVRLKQRGSRFFWHLTIWCATP